MVSISAAHRNWPYSLLSVSPQVLLVPLGRLPCACVQTKMHPASRSLLSSWNHYASAVLLSIYCILVFPIICRLTEKQCRAKNWSPVKTMINSPVSGEERLVWVHQSGLCFVHGILHLLCSVSMSFSAHCRVLVHWHHCPQNTQPHCRVLTAS